MTLAPEHQKVVDSLKLLVSEELKVRGKGGLWASKSW